MTSRMQRRARLISETNTVPIIGLFANYVTQTIHAIMANGLVRTWHLVSGWLAVFRMLCVRVITKGN